MAISWYNKGIENKKNTAFLNGIPMLNQYYTRGDEMPKAIDVIGQRFGSLVVVRQSDVRKWGGILRECQCDCGNTVLVSLSNLKAGSTTSCGCYHRKKLDEAIKKHGMSKTPVYITWMLMRQRCNNPNHPGYHNYGGRGIKVCPQWDDFEQFFADMGERPVEKTLDRIDVNRDYCPENCQWATRIQQANNKRENIVISYDGKTLTLKQWSRELGMNYWTLHARYKRGWNLTDIITTNIKETKNESV